MLARRSHLNIMYDNVDITEDLRPHLISWSYTDNMSGEIDDMQITLEDRDQLWSGDWMPEEGAKLTATVIRENWESDGKTDELPLGTFEVDEIEADSPPSTVTIKALSVPESSSLRGERKNRAWEKTKLSVVARDIASGAGLTLFYDTGDDPEYDRVEQVEQTDLEFLMAQCKNAGLCLKVSDLQLVIFDERKYEQQEIVDTIYKSDKRIKSRSGRRTLNGVYRACRVSYHDATAGTTIEHTFTPDNPPKTSRILVVNDRVASVKEAQILARKKLRDANKNAVTYSLTMSGDLTYLAGMTVNLEEFGFFDGKYVITQAGLGQRDGLETKLSLRKVLEGY